MKFSIITPVYNGGKYIAETIGSVLSQEGNFEIEYIIQDGGSSDETLNIIKRYEKILNEKKYSIKCRAISYKWFSEKDNGMYDAINKGFSQATGDIFAYINADDKYISGAFAAVISIFSLYHDIEWIKGINTTADSNGNIVNNGKCLLYRQEWVQKGIYGRSAYFIQQDSVFWKRTLWEKSKPNIASYRFAGDYALWVSFAKHASLWSFNKKISIFRKRSGQLSDDMKSYRKEQEAIAHRRLFLEKRVSLFFLMERFFKTDSKNIVSKILFFILFPFQKKQWYIDTDGEKFTKKKAKSYIV